MGSWSQVLEDLLAAIGITSGFTATEKCVGNVVQQLQFRKIVAGNLMQEALQEIANEVKSTGANHALSVSVDCEETHDNKYVLLVWLNVYRPLPTKPRTILHINAGDADWEPSTSDLNTLADLFMSARDSLEGGTVVTRNGVTCKLVEIQETTDVKLVTVVAKRDQE